MRANGHFAKHWGFRCAGEKGGGERTGNLVVPFRVPCTARLALPKTGGSTSTLLTVLLALVRSLAADQPASR